MMWIDTTTPLRSEVPAPPVGRDPRGTGFVRGLEAAHAGVGDAGVLEHRLPLRLQAPGCDVLFSPISNSIETSCISKEFNGMMSVT